MADDETGKTVTLFDDDAHPLRAIRDPDQNCGIATALSHNKGTVLFGMWSEEGYITFGLNLDEAREYLWGVLEDLEDV